MEGQTQQKAQSPTRPDLRKRSEGTVSKNSLVSRTTLQDGDIELRTVSKAANDDDGIMEAITREVTQSVSLSDNIGDEIDEDRGTDRKEECKSKWHSERIESNEGTKGIKVISPPPKGHRHDFFSIMKKQGHFTDKAKFFPDQKLQLLNKQKLLSRVIGAVAPHANLLPYRKDNRTWARRGVRFIDLVSKVPLSKAWHVFTEVLAMVVFIANVVVGVYDILREAVHLHYKIPALLLSLVENTILFFMWLILRSKRFQKNGERSLKHQQYIENIVHEVSKLCCIHGLCTE